jgi:hypothetical protein
MHTHSQDRALCKSDYVWLASVGAEAVSYRFEGGVGGRGVEAQWRRFLVRCIIAGQPWRGRSLCFVLHMQV